MAIKFLEQAWGKIKNSPAKINAYIQKMRDEDKRKYDEEQVTLKDMNVKRMMKAGMSLDQINEMNKPKVKTGMKVNRMKNKDGYTYGM